MSAKQILEKIPADTTAAATDDENKPRWAIVELMGHVRYGGLVSKDTMLGTAMLRIDVPTNATEFATQLINPASLYRLTFSTEALARLAAKSGQQRPIDEWEIESIQRPRQLAIEMPEED